MHRDDVKRVRRVVPGSGCIEKEPGVLWKTGSRSSVAREARPAYDLRVPAHRKLLRVYVDTSVVGGCLDEEFRSPSNRLIERSRSGDALLVISDTTLAELAGAPPELRNVSKTYRRDAWSSSIRTKSPKRWQRSTSGMR